MLGRGIYVTTTLEKALNYAKLKPYSGAVLQLHLDLGRCYSVSSRDDPYIRTWQDQGYDSAYAAAGVIGNREEHCIKDPSRIRVTNVVLGQVSQAEAAGFRVVASKLTVDSRRLQEMRDAEARRITVHVKGLGQTQHIRCDRDERIEEFRRLLGAGFLSEEFKLVHSSGWELLNGRKLTSYGVQNNSTLHTIPIVHTHRRGPSAHTSGVSRWQPDLSQLPVW
jgi:hypothetical protein